MTQIQSNWQDLIKPNKLEFQPGADPSRLAVVVAEPLERGFALTLGNALRRVLLSSLQGSAVTAVQIDGVLHEFSSIPGVREDVTDIVLNLQGVALRMEVEGPKRVSISAKGPGVVTAGDISETNGIDVLKSYRALGWSERRFKGLSAVVRDAGIGLANIRVANLLGGVMSIHYGEKRRG